jgi:hypothetical protein
MDHPTMLGIVNRFQGVLFLRQLRARSELEGDFGPDNQIALCGAPHRGPLEENRPAYVDTGGYFVLLDEIPIHFGASSSHTFRPKGVDGPAYAA